MFNWIIFKFWLVPVFYITIYLKGGSKYSGYFTELTTNTNGNTITNMKWKCVSGQMIDINLDSISLITSKKYNWSIL